MRTDGAVEGNSIVYLDTMLQYYLGIVNPSALSDEEWCLKIKQLERIRQRESQSQ